jgi:hypothetical protein
MSKTKTERAIGHTPGPWRVDLNQYDNEYRVYADGEEKCPVINSLFKAKGEIGLANARLIAAAPDLLEALEDAARHFENIAYEIKRGNVSNAAEIAKNNVRYAKEAIAKAEGQE